MACDELMMACDELRMANPSRWKKLKLRNLKSEDFPMARVGITVL